MENEEIIRYVLSQDVVEIPTVQKKFDLSYTEAKSIMDLLASIDMIEYISGVAFKVLTKKKDQEQTQPVYDDDPDRIMYKKALWECVKRKTVSMAVLQRELNIGFCAAGKAIDWMEENCYIRCYDNKEVLLSEEEYKLLFGDPNKPFKAKYEMNLKETEEQKRHEEKIKRLALYDNCDDEDEEDEECFSVFRDDFVDDDTECSDAKRNKPLTMPKEDFDNIMKSFSPEVTEEKEYDIMLYKPRRETEYSYLPNMLSDCFTLGLEEKEQGEEYVIDLDDDKKFEIKFTNNGESLRISDGGCTLSQRDFSSRRVKNLLKDYPSVELDGKEIAITIDNPKDMLKSVLKLYAAVDVVKKIK